MLTSDSETSTLRPVFWRRYRLIRVDELERERAAAARLDAERLSAQERERDLLVNLADMQGKLQAALTHADFVTTRVNVLENEVAQFRQLANPNVKQIVPSIGKQPINAAAFEGVGADMFADVGDEEAARLEEKGLLNDPSKLAPVATTRAESLAPTFKES